MYQLDRDTQSYTEDQFIPDQYFDLLSAPITAKVFNIELSIIFIKLLFL